LVDLFEITELCSQIHKLVMFTDTQVDRFYMSKYETSVGRRKVEWVKIQHDSNKPIIGHNPGPK